MPSTQTQLSQLECLPTEVLIRIFNDSENPNLIFVSRRFHSFTAYESIRRDLARQICDNVTKPVHHCGCRFNHYPNCGRDRGVPVSIDAILTFDDFAREEWLTIGHITDAALWWMKRFAVMHLTAHLNRHSLDQRKLFDSDPAAKEHWQKSVRDPEIEKLKKHLSTRISRSSVAAAVSPHISYLQSVNFFTYTTTYPDGRSSPTIQFLWPPAVAPNPTEYHKGTWGFLSMYVQHHLPHPIFWFDMMDKPVRKTGRWWDDWFSRALNSAEVKRRPSIVRVDISDDGSV